jgi:hypothetical protein
MKPRKFASLHDMTPVFQVKIMPEILISNGTIYWGRVTSKMDGSIEPLKDGAKERRRITGSRN